MLQKLRAIISSLPDDGSREMAKEWERLAITADEMSELLARPAFKAIVDSQLSRMRGRLHELVQKDPELSAMKNVMNRTIGLEQSKIRVERMIDDYLKEADETP